MYNESMSEIHISTDKDVWDEFILDNDGHPLQLCGWGQVKAANGWTAERYFWVDGDDVVAAAQVLIRPLPTPLRSFAYIPRGPVVSEGIDAGEFLDSVALMIKKHHGSVALSVEPNSREMILSPKWRRSSNHILSKETILLDLTLSESDLLAGMAKKTRQYIRKSAAEGITIRRVRSEADVRTCIEMYQQTARRAGFNLHRNQYYTDVIQSMGDHSPIFAAYLDGSPLAFLWVAVSASSAYELYGGMNDDGQRLRANYALKWHVIRKVKEWGLSEYDFGGLVAGGVSVFKLGWSQQPTEMAGTFDLPLSPLYPVWNRLLPGAKKVAQKLRRKA